VVEQREFDIALSFAGENRDYVDQVATLQFLIEERQRQGFEILASLFRLGADQPAWKRAGCGKT
jgi:hypothetical protein